MTESADKEMGIAIAQELTRMGFSETVIVLRREFREKFDVELESRLTTTTKTLQLVDSKESKVTFNSREQPQKKPKTESVTPEAKDDVNDIDDGAQTLVGGKPYQRVEHVRVEHVDGDEMPLESTSTESSALPSSSKLLQTSSSCITSVCSKQGRRFYMEDEYFVSPDGDFVAVFDGHGGPSVSLYLRKNFYTYVQEILPRVVAARDEQAMTCEDDDIENPNIKSSPETTLSGSGTDRPASMVGSVPSCKDFETAL